MTLPSRLKEGMAHLSYGLPVKFCKASAEILVTNFLETFNDDVHHEGLMFTNMLKPE